MARIPFGSELVGNPCCETFVQAQWALELVSLHVACHSNYANVADHCDEDKARRTRNCFYELHFAYCSAWIVTEQGVWLRCSELFAIFSNGCDIHPYVLGFNLAFQQARREGRIEFDPADFRNPNIKEIQGNTAGESDEARAERNRQIEAEAAERIDSAIKSQGPEVTIDNLVLPHEEFERIKKEKARVKFEETMLKRQTKLEETKIQKEESKKAKTFKDKLDKMPFRKQKKIIRQHEVEEEDAKKSAAKELQTEMMSKAAAEANGGMSIWRRGGKKEGKKEEPSDRKDKKKKN